MVKLVGTTQKEARSAKEFHVEHPLHEVILTRIAPVTEQMILSFIGETVLGLPKSY